MINEEIRVLDHGFIRLDGLMADDLSVVNSARVSFGSRHTEIEEGDEKLIQFLLRERHGTPVEHNAFRFHVKAPIFVFREWQRHRISSYNELSGRYKVFENPDFYIPKEFRTQVGKPGQYTFEKWQGNTQMAQTVFLRHCQDAYDLYKWAVDSGMAKEQARLVLPLNLYSEMYWTTNLRSIMNFLSLRNDKNAQWEIREYARIVEEIVTEHMPLTMEAFQLGGRVAP